MLATEKGDASNAVKYNDFNSYIKNIFIGINPFVGAGLGSVFWGEGRGVFHSSSEQTYMDIIRIYGAFVGFFSYFTSLLSYFSFFCIVNTVIY